MHPIRKLRESGHATSEQFAALLDENVVMHSPLLTKAILGRDTVAKTMAASSRNRDNPGEYVLERKLDENTTFLRWKGRSKATNSRAWNCSPTDLTASSRSGR